MSDVTDGVDVAAVAASRDAAEARAAIKGILARMIDKLAGSVNESWSLFILREQMHPTQAFDRIYDGAMGRMFDVLVELVGVAAGLDDQVAARIAVLTLFGQVVVLRAARATGARLLGSPLDDPALITQFHQRIVANTDAILDSMATQRRGHA